MTCSRPSDPPSVGSNLVVSVVVTVSEREGALVEQPTVTCPRCGTAWPSRFCGRCGARLRERPSSDEPTQLHPGETGITSRDTDLASRGADAAVPEPEAAPHEDVGARFPEAVEVDAPSVSFRRQVLTLGLVIAVVAAAVLVTVRVTQRPPETITASTPLGGIDGARRTSTRAVTDLSTTRWRAEGLAVGNYPGRGSMLWVGQAEQLGDHVAVIVNGQLLVFDAGTATLVWRLAGVNWFASAGGRIVTTLDEEVVWLDVGTGEIQGRLVPEERDRVGLRAARGAVALVATQGTLVAVDLDHASERWAIDLGPEVWVSSAAMTDDRGYVTWTRDDSQFNLSAVDLASGDLLWTVDARSWVDRLVVSPDGAIVVAAGEIVEAFDARTGVRRWRSTAIPDPSRGLGLDLDPRGIGVIERSDQTGRATLQTLDWRSGQVVRQLAIPTSGLLHWARWLDDGSALIADEDAVGRYDGEGWAWRLDDGDVDLQMAEPVATGDWLLLGVEGPSLDIYGLADGQLLHREPMPSIGSSTLLLHGSTLLWQTDVGWQQIDAVTGEEVEDLPIRYRYTNVPISAGEDGLVIWDEGQLFLYREGEEVWTTRFSGGESAEPIALVGDLLVVGSYGFPGMDYGVPGLRLTSVDVTTGEERSRTTLQGWLDSPAWIPGAEGAPALGIGTLYPAQGGAPELLALELTSDGEFRERWRRPTRAPTRIVQTSAGAVAVTATTMRRLDPRTGEVLAERDFERPISPEATVTAGTVVVTDGGRSLMGFDVETLTERWATELPFGIAAAPTSAGDLVYVVDLTDTLMGLDAASGRPISSTVLPARPATPPVTAFGQVHVGLVDGTMVAVGPEGVAELPTPSP